ncbi:hypothetical protein ACQ4WX_06020 [Streptomyces lasalocidi]
MNAEPAPVAKHIAERRPVPGAAVLRLERRSTAGGHSGRQPDRQEPGRHPDHPAAALGHTRDIAVLAGTVEIVEIDALPPQELRARELMRDGRCLVSHSPDT